jgi:O-methyltransferase / aklanonic acid methyltransferase
MDESTKIDKQMVEQIFDGAAESYNRVGPGIFTQFGERLISYMSLKPGMGVLDVATGTGAALLPAAKQIGREGHITGIDLSGAILKQAARNVRAAGLANVTLRKMDAEHLNFPDRTFDAVICAFAIFLFPDVNAALREISRVCKPGACLGVTVFNKTIDLFAPAFGLLTQTCATNKVYMLQTAHHVAYAPEEMESLLQQSGFHSVETKVEANDIVYAKADDWWEFLLMGAARATIMGMDEKFRARFREDYFARLRPLFRPDGLHVSIPVVYTVAQR